MPGLGAFAAMNADASRCLLIVPAFPDDTQPQVNMVFNGPGL
jgi:hypothetical protein